VFRPSTSRILPVRQNRKPRRAQATPSANPKRPRNSLILAFTLIELLALVAIVGTLASIILGVGTYTHRAAKVARAKAELAGIAAAIEKYSAKYGDYPQTNDVALLLQSLLGKRGPNGAAIADVAVIETDRFTFTDGANPHERSDVTFTDPWDNPYQYRYYSSGKGRASFVFYSAGPDLAATAPDVNGRFDPAAPENADNIYAHP
jgi:type II secretory pathway pseudopilin PulG